MRIAAAQLNQVVGDFRGNAERIIAAAQRAAAQGARVLLTPELSLSGYPPEDLLLRAAFHEGCERALQQVCDATAALDLHLLVGHPRRRGAQRYNGASLIHRGRVTGEYDKLELPNYDVFDEERYLEPGEAALVFEVDGVRFGVLICEDFWYPRAPAMAQAAGDSLILFPEGTRNAEALPLPFKSGLYHLAERHPQVELVAVYLDNARRSLPKGSLLPVPLICTVRFGEVIQRMDGESKADFLERARNAVVKLA